MKREDIENAAKKEAENLACLVYYGGSAISQEDVENAFVKGAEWRIDSVWHDALDFPSFKYILVQTCYRCEVIRIKKESWLTYIENYKVIRWAYIEDLIPNTKD